MSMKTKVSRPFAIFLSAFLIFLLIAALALSLAERAVKKRRDEREAAVMNAVLSSCAEFQLPPALLLAVIRAESDFRANASSSAGALGLMQILPETLTFIDTLLSDACYAEKDLLSPEINIRCGACYLDYLQKSFDDLTLVLCAYNAGEGRVRTWLSDPTLSKDGVLLKIPFPETQNYVNRVYAFFEEYTAKYNLK